MKRYRIEDHPDYQPSWWWNKYRLQALAALPSREPYYSAGQPLREGGKWRTAGYWGSVELWLKDTIKTLEAYRADTRGEERAEASEVIGELTSILIELIPLSRAASQQHFELLTKPVVLDDDDWGF